MTVSRPSRWNPHDANGSSRARAASSAPTSPSSRDGSDQPTLRTSGPLPGHRVRGRPADPDPEAGQRIRIDRSVLLVPGDMFGIEKGIRFGFGFDIQHTLKGLALAGETLASLGASLA